MAEVSTNPGVTQESMAQGVNGTTAPGAAPTQVRTPATPSPANGVAGQQSQTGQTQDPSFWNGDVNSLSPEGQAVYKQLYGDYTRKRMEETNRVKEVQAKLDQYERELKQYNTDKTEWQKWQPVLQQVSTRWRDIEPILTGKQQATPTQGVQRQPGESTQAAVSRYIENLTNDDFLTPQHFDRGMEKFEADYTQKMQQSMEQQARQYFQQIMQYVNGMQTLYDQALELKLQNLYGMKPQEGVEFNLNDVIQTARELGIGDLQAAYKIKYGEANARRQAELQSQQQQKTIEQIRAEEYQRGLKEGQLVAHNANSGFIPSVPNLPKFEAKKVVDGYSNVENILRDKLMNSGVRGG